jgi:hypothetical protein
MARLCSVAYQHLRLLSPEVAFRESKFDQVGTAVVRPRVQRNLPDLTTTDTAFRLSRHGSSSHPVESLLQFVTSSVNQPLARPSGPDRPSPMIAAPCSVTALK